MFILSSPEAIIEEQFDEFIENWLRETFDIDIDFEVDDALDKLEKLNLLKTDENNLLSVENIDQALVIMDDYWDNLYNFVD
jgi:hypothetical protein